MDQKSTTVIHGGHSHRSLPKAESIFTTVGTQRVAAVVARSALQSAALCAAREAFCESASHKVSFRRCRQVHLTSSTYEVSRQGPAMLAAADRRPPMESRRLGPPKFAVKLYQKSMPRKDVVLDSSWLLGSLLESLGRAKIGPRGPKFAPRGLSRESPPAPPR